MMSIMKMMEETFKMMMIPSLIQNYLQMKQSPFQQFDTNNMWTNTPQLHNPPGTGYLTLKNAAYRGGQGLTNKQKKPKNWSWWHGIIRHDSRICKKLSNSHQKTATVTHMLGSQLCVIIQDK